MTLYININGDDIRSTENMTVVGRPGESIINRFYYELAKGIVKGVSVPGIGDLKNKSLVKDFEEHNNEAFAKITVQWDSAKQVLLGENPHQAHTVTLPKEYVEWLHNHRDSRYNSIARSLADRGNVVEIDLGNIYRNGLNLLVNNIDKDKEYECFVVSDTLVDDESAIAVAIRNKIGEGVPFIPFNEWKESVERYNKEKEEDEAFNNCTTIEACDSYLQAYPQGRYVSEVLARKAKLQKPSSLTISANGVSFVMKPVEGGSFLMGAQSKDDQEDNYDPDADNNEGPVHEVTLSDYYIGETQVTQALWKAVMGTEPTYNGGWTYGRGNNYPAYRVSWVDICGSDGKGTDPNCFLYKLNCLTGKCFRLPTEAEWEYAARGGRLLEGYPYSGSDDIDEVAWYDGNSGNETHAVKCKKANELGLYDMSGNVWEWCNDWYDNDYYEDSPSDNPKGPSSGSPRVLRGGGWGSDARNCRVSGRHGLDPGNGNYGSGFRLCLPQ